MLSTKKLVRKNRIAHVILASSLAGLVACGGGSGSDSSTGTFSLAVTDAPIDNATRVIIEFTGVSIKPADGEVVEFEFAEPKSINMLDLQGSLSEGLITNEEVAAGEYEWIRLAVNAEEDNIMDSFIEFDDGSQIELRIPSGSQTGLKLVRGFTVPVGGNADFTVDFDLRKSITDPSGKPSATFKPTLRIVDNVTVGTIAGTIDATLVSQQCEDASLDDGAVYVYEGADVTPADVQGAETDPLVSALVNVVEGQFSYEVGFLSEGSYTISYTCGAGADNPEQADEIVFSGTANVTVTADTVTTHNFIVE